MEKTLMKFRRPLLKSCTVEKKARRKTLLKNVSREGRPFKNLRAKYQKFAQKKSAKGMLKNKNPI